MGKLPKSIFIESTAKAERERLDKSQANLQKNVLCLSELLDFEITTIRQIEALTPEWLENEILSSKKNVRMAFGSGIGFIPRKVSKSLSDEYDKVHEACKEPVEQLRKELAFARENGLSLYLDANGVPRYNEEDVERYVQEKSIYTFSEEEKAFFPIIASIFESMDEVRKFEKEHGCVPCNLQGIIEDRFRVNISEGKGYRLSPNDFLSLRMWGKVLGRKQKVSIEEEE